MRRLEMSLEDFDLDGFQPRSFLLCFGQAVLIVRAKCVNCDEEGKKTVKSPIKTIIVKT